MNASLKLHSLYKGSPFGTGYTVVINDGSIYCIASKSNTVLGRGRYFGNLKDEKTLAQCTFADWHQIKFHELPEKCFTFLSELVTNLNLQPVKTQLCREEVVSLTVREKFFLWKKKVRTSES